VVARDSRKIFRLFKSINELDSLKQKIEKDLVWQPNKTPVVLEILSRLGFFFYWIFDNIQILASIKFLNADPNFHLKLASYGWFFGVLFAILKQLLDLISLLKKKNANVEKSDNLDFLILKTAVEISGKLGDLIVAANGAGLIQMIKGGKPLSDGVLGASGFWSSLVALGSLYLK
jgi:peroxin-11B